ncbi:hypothetical protein GM415_08645 [Pseudodesulfovibrio cashew]|uniref:DUF2628 domain-containing protein n=1 Tax=Pseudodesulfovibrio cashew TaxID=2678688 RepID=A0A6I6JIG5_9BACT|nr:hypothetical protein [Pseudodesulfovibrio cashew]QGY40193.1 hypothetical protein GM415_08645 [Pseudodesulfovibrio cashew]
MNQAMGPHSAEDYAAFIDRNVHKFLPKFSTYCANPASFHPGWNWAAFFFTFWWYLYRKMYLWAALCFVTMWLPYFNLIIWIGWGVAANSLYFRHANTKIAEAKAFYGSGYQVYLRDAGGVNTWVPWVALLISGGFFLLALLGFISMAFFAAAF